MLLPVSRYGVFNKVIRVFLFGEDRYPDSMMFIHGIDNNILNSGAHFSRVYQEESKMWDLYQDPNMFWG